MWGRSTCALGTAPGRPQPCAVGTASLNPLIATRTGLQLKILWDFASSRIEAFPLQGKFTAMLQDETLLEAVSCRASQAWAVRG